MKEELLKVIIASLALMLATSAGCTQQTSSKAEESTREIAAAPPIQVSSEKTDAAEPAMAAATDGTVYVTWVEHYAEGADVWLRRINPDESRNEAVRVNPEKGAAKAWRGDPPTVAVSAEGTVYVAWSARAATKGHETNLYLSASRDGGKSFEPPVKVNDDAKPARHGMHSLALDKEGRVYLAWLDERNVQPAAPMGMHRGEMAEKESNSEVFVAHSEDGGRTFAKNQMIGREACPCCKTAITTAPDGKIHVGFRQVLKGDYRHIAVSSSSDKGRNFSSPIIVSDDQWMIAACPVSGPSLSVGEDGALRVLWYTEGEAGAQGLYFTISRDAGQTFSRRQLIARGHVRGNPLLVSDARGNKTAAVWQGGDGTSTNMMRAEITSDGTISGATDLKNAGDLPAAVAANSQIFAAYIMTMNKQRSIWLGRAGKF